jgi:hypothetical protein
VAWSTISSHKIRGTKEGSAHPSEREGTVDGSEGRCSRSMASAWRPQAARVFPPLVRRSTAAPRRRGPPGNSTAQRWGMEQGM